MAGFTFLLLVLCLSTGVPQLKAASLDKVGRDQLHSHQRLNVRRDSISCDACKSTVQHLRMAQKSDSEVKTPLKKSCKSLSGTQRSLCENFVHSYKPQLSKMLQKSQKEKDICGELNICVRKRTLQPLGADECTWGPAYWCKDQETATKCKAVDYCKSHPKT